MGKRRNAENKKRTGGEGDITGSKGSGGVDNGDFAVFDFADDDMLVETESRKSLAKFGTKSPGKKTALHRRQVDKYAFLARFVFQRRIRCHCESVLLKCHITSIRDNSDICIHLELEKLIYSDSFHEQYVAVAQGTTSQQKDAGSDVFNVDATETASQIRKFGTDMTVSPGSLNYDHPQSFLKHQGFECSLLGAKSCAPGIRKPGGYRTDKKHNQVLYVDSDEDGQMDLGSSCSSFDLGLSVNEGSPVEQSSEYGASNNKFEAMVVVAPHYVKYANMHYTRCHLTFSQRHIRLEGTTLCQNPEWSTIDIAKIEYQHCESVKADVVNLHIKSKDINGAGTGNGSSGGVELEFVVLDDPQWSEKLEDIKLLDLKYRDAWETITSECNFDESFEDIIYPDGDPDAVFISRRDIELLRPRTFINDTIIDFYIKYLVNKTNREKQHRFHFFNTFFFQKLVDKGRDLSRTWEGSDAFQRVRKWTRNINIFEKDYIFIPVNLSLHWSLIVICHAGEVSNLRGMDSSSKVPCILHMDSIRGSHRGLENLIQSYLWEEWKERGNKQAEDISIKFLNLDFIELQPPQQDNFFDCGIFLLHYAELFLEQAPNFNETNHVDFFNKDWFLAAEVSLKKRDHIRKVIHGIAKDNALKDPPAAPNNQHTQSGTNSVQQNSLKESSLAHEFNSSDGFEVRGQQSFSAKFERNSSAIDESFQPCKLLLPPLPINQFNSMTLPVEDTLENQAILSGETSSSESPILIDSQNDYDCVFEVESSIERQKGSDSSSMSSEDLEACIVEDSEEESEAVNITRTRKSY